MNQRVSTKHFEDIAREYGENQKDIQLIKESMDE